MTEVLCLWHCVRGDKVAGMAPSSLVTTYMNYLGENDKKICMGQIRHIIAQGLALYYNNKTTPLASLSRTMSGHDMGVDRGPGVELFCNILPEGDQFHHFLLV